MTNQELYDGIANEGLSLPSAMGIFPSSNDVVFSKEFIENQLKGSNYFTLISFISIYNKNTIIITAVKNLIKYS